MIPEERNTQNGRQDDDNSAQRIFEEGMPDSVGGSAEPSSLDDSLGETDINDSGLQISDIGGSGSSSDENSDQGRSSDSIRRSDQEGPSFAQREVSFRGGQLSSEAHSHIKGWGIDADPLNDPTYPIKKRTNEEQLGNTWKRPTLQEQTVELLISNERNNVPAIFSTTEPPKGFSGVLRRKAFKYSESDLRHWLSLMFADKIGVLEGKIDDIRHGHIPNPIAELGLGAEWKYNRKEFVKKSLVKTAVVGAAVGLVLLSRKSKNSKKKTKSGFFDKVMEAV
jgi:hypothetical protein